jgi:para-aminobenzoate synthetase component I
MSDFNFHQRSSIFRHLSKEYAYASRFESNGYEDKYGRFNWIIVSSSKAILHQQKADEESWDELENATMEFSDASFLTCLLAYDLKNSKEKLQSTNPDFVEFPELCLWKPEVLIAQKRDGTLWIEGKYNENDFRTFAIDTAPENKSEIKFEKAKSLSSEEYALQFEKLKKHIQQGDIYEVNYCREEKGVVKNLNPIALFELLNKNSPAPFACIHKAQKHWLVSSSPERFLHKKDNVLTSQPIKGTTKRGLTKDEDEVLQAELFNNPKERSENVMIVDLVRNDLSVYASRGSVEVKELCGIFPFATVSHMISTVQAKLKDSNLHIKALKAAFPMGSMTGAPKYRAMQLIEDHEDFKRGIYSGATGYFLKHGDFDFNVIIRSFAWNEENGHLSFSTGSAITISAEAAKEFQECELKAQALWKTLLQS